MRILEDQEGYVPSVYELLMKDDLVSMFQPSIDTGEFTYNMEDGKIWRTINLSGELESAGPINRPWCYTHTPKDQPCIWYRSIEKLFGFIPSKCLNCWKVVVRPQSIVELFDLCDLQHEMAAEDDSCHCKCGIEKRDYVFGNYGGYFYNPSLEKGLDRRDEVREKC
ncbi:unnamed protein product, partial [marine sediment metagenome]